jgi:hypothetical protein
MASARHLWDEFYWEDRIPALPCPRCDRGNLIADDHPKTLYCNRSADALQTGDANPLDITYRFTQFLRCADPTCGQVVSVMGDAEMVDRDHMEADEYRMKLKLFPKGMFPAPPLATIPIDTPAAIAEELKIAFNLFWVDLGACANRIRISVERFLDELGVVPKPTLFARIQDLVARDPDHAETFHALREAGNVGSHSGDNTRETVLNAFEIYQDALAEIYGKRKQRIIELKKAIRASKGR